MDAKGAKKRLIEGNLAYLNASRSAGDVSPMIRIKTANEGQFPYAVIITCSDSRVIPESIFSAGIGKLFVIRVAGNVACEYVLGSVEYAVEHLGVKLVVVMGHTNCGAVGAAMGGHAAGFVAGIVGEIQAAIGGEKDAYKASCLNAAQTAEKVRQAMAAYDVVVEPAMYHIGDGKVEFLN